MISEKSNKRFASSENLGSCDPDLEMFFREYPFEKFRNFFPRISLVDFGDIFQEAMLKAWKDRLSFRVMNSKPQESVHNWFSRILANTFNDYSEKRKRDLGRFDFVLPETLVLPKREPCDFEDDSAETIVELSKLLLSVMTENQRDKVRQIVMDGRKQRSVASQDGVSEQAIGAQVALGLKTAKLRIAKLPLKYGEAISVAEVLSLIEN